MKRFIFMAFIMLCSCNNAKWRTTESSQEPCIVQSVGSVGFSSMEANSSQCQNGGKVLYFWLDVNDNNIYDAGDLDFKSTLVCNTIVNTDEDCTVHIQNCHNTYCTHKCHKDR